MFLDFDGRCYHDDVGYFNVDEIKALIKPCFEVICMSDGYMDSLGAE